MPAQVVNLNRCRLCDSDDIALYQVKNKDYICRSCNSKNKRKKYLANREKYIRAAKSRYDKTYYEYGSKKWASNTVVGLRYFDRRKLKFPVCDITVEDLLNIVALPCTYCGDSQDRIGVDRVDNSIGHIKTNLVPSCYSCNSVRMANWTHEEMKTIGSAIAKIKACRRKI